MLKKYLKLAGAISISVIMYDALYATLRATNFLLELIKNIVVNEVLSKDTYVLLASQFMIILLLFSWVLFKTMCFWIGRIIKYFKEIQNVKKNKKDN